MSFTDTFLAPRTNLTRRSARTAVHGLVEELTAFVDSGDGYHYLDVLDLSESTNYTLIFAPTGGPITYKADTIYELDTDKLPDVTKSYPFIADTIVLADVVAKVAASTEVIPFLRLGIKVAPSTATYLKIILALRI